MSQDSLVNPIVIKIGGSTLGNHDTTLEDIVTLQKRGVPLVVVHGGARRVTEWLDRHGISTSFVDGVRVTDERSLEVVAAVLGGLVNTELVAAINSLGGEVVGMTGVDGNLIESKIEDPRLGVVGRIVRVNPRAVQSLLQAGLVPLIAPPAAKALEETASVPFINVNGDDIVGELAVVLNAERLIFLTDVDGIQDDDGTFMEELSREKAVSLMKSGVISGGMIPKARSALTALKTARKVQIVDGRQPHALLNAIEGDGSGTNIQ
ncbi:MAG: acetylglutamate kinase [Dehalococcoidia bacterium]